MPGHVNTGYRTRLAIPERPLRKSTDAILGNLQGLLRSLADGADARGTAKAYAHNLFDNLSHRHQIPTQAELAEVCATFCDAYLKATTPPNPG